MRTFLLQIALIFSVSQFPLSNTLTVPWIQAGHYIFDLIGNNNLSFAIQAKYWMINGVDNPDQTKSYFCQGLYVGGLGILNLGSYLQRTYDSLPSHNMVSYFIRFLIIDDWRPSEEIIISFKDTSHTFSVVPANRGTANSDNSSFCGNSFPEQIAFMVEGIFFHSSNSLTVKIKTNLVTNDRSFGIRGVRIALHQVGSTQTEQSCAPVNFPGLAPSFSGKCNCPPFKFLNTTTGLCQSCHSSCSHCYGPTEKDCLFCSGGYSFDGQSCILCTANCTLCSGPSVNQCNLCNLPSILHPDNTCKNYCSAPNSLLDLGDYKMCIKTACQLNGTYMYANGSCLSECSTPYKQRIEGMVKYCDRPCNNSLDYYYESDSKCKFGCEYPYKKKDNDTCIKALSDQDLAQLKALTDTSYITGAIIKCVGTTISLINFASPAAFFLEGLTDMLKYIRYMNITYPPKLQTALDTDIELPIAFNPEFYEQILNMFPAKSLPAKFEKYQLHSSFFINFWDSTFTLAAICLGIIVLSLLEWTSRKYRSIHSFFMNAKIALKWNFFLGFFTPLIGEIVLYTSLELRTCYLNTLPNLISLLLCVFVNALVLIVFIKMIEVIWTLRKLRKSKQNTIQRGSRKRYFSSFEIIYEQFKPDLFIQQSCMFIFMVRSYLFNTIIAYLFEYPLVQTTTITAVSLLMILYLGVFRPPKQIIDLVQYILQEVIILIINVCVLILSLLDSTGKQDFETRRVVGDIVIYLMTSFSVIGVLYLLLQFLVLLRNILKRIIEYLTNHKLKSKKNKEKMVDQSDAIELPFQQPSDNANNKSDYTRSSNTINRNIYPSRANLNNKLFNIYNKKVSKQQSSYNIDLRQNSLALPQLALQGQNKGMSTDTKALKTLNNMDELKEGHQEISLMKSSKKFQKLKRKANR